MAKYVFGVDIGGTTVKIGLSQQKERWLTSGRSQHAPMRAESIS